MHPGMLYRWKYGRRHADWGAWAGCGPDAGFHRWEGRFEASPHHGEYMRTAFGVRRPLRFLAYKLQLEEAQIGELARILDEIKTERAQAAVDHRRALSTFADAISGEVFDRAKAEAGAKLRLESADRLRAAVVTALGRLHELLDSPQRARLAYLIRTGTLSI